MDTNGTSLKNTSQDFESSIICHWFTSENEEQLQDFKRRKLHNLAKDKDGRDVFLADSRYALELAQEKYTDIEFHFTSEF